MSGEKMAEALRELFVTWLESRPPFRTTVEAKAAWEGWKANTAVAAMLAAEAQAEKPAAYALFTDEGLIRMWSRDWFGAANGLPVNPTPLYTRPHSPPQATEPVAWMTRGACTGEPVFSTTPPDESNVAGWTPLYTHLPAQQDAEGKYVCVWSEDHDGNWDTGCGRMFVLNDGTPYDNEMGFCCYCGHRLEQETQADAAMKEPE